MIIINEILIIRVGMDCLYMAMTDTKSVIYHF